MQTLLRRSVCFKMPKNNGALSKPSSVVFQWVPKSPIQDQKQLVLALQKQFPNHIDFQSLDGGRVQFNFSYTSSLAKIEERLEPFNGYVRGRPLGALSLAEEDTVDGLFASLQAKPPGGPLKKRAKKRKVEEPSSEESDEEDAVPEEFRPRKGN